MFTASHNPAAYNGIKLCLAGAVPLSLETGLAEVRDEAQALLDGAGPAPAARRAASPSRTCSAEYAEYLRSLVDLSGIRPLHVAVDAGNGMAGYTVPGGLRRLPLGSSRCTSSWTAASPTTRPTRSTRPTWWTCRPRCGGPARTSGWPSTATPTAASWSTSAASRSRQPRHRPGGRPRVAPGIPARPILHNLITSRAVPEIVLERGGVPVRTRVGHSFIKAEMARTGAIFGGEHSAHYYFADFYRADTGMLAAMHVLAALGEQDRPLSELVAEYSRYAASGEINSDRHRCRGGPRQDPGLGGRTRGGRR